MVGGDDMALSLGKETKDGSGFRPDFHAREWQLGGHTPCPGAERQQKSSIPFRKITIVYFRMDLFGRGCRYGGVPNARRRSLAG